MRLFFSDQLDQFARKLFPFVFTLFLVLLSVLPLPVSVPGFVAPLVTLMAVFYWGISRADLMPYAAVFIVGVLEDVLNGTPLGMSALVLLLVHALTVSQRRVLFGRSFTVLWLAFGIIATCAVTLRWTIFSILAGDWVNPYSALFQLFATFMFYPLLAWLMMRAQATLLKSA